VSALLLLLATEEAIDDLAGQVFEAGAPQEPARCSGPRTTDPASRAGRRTGAPHAERNHQLAAAVHQRRRARSSLQHVFGQRARHGETDDRVDVAVEAEAPLAGTFVARARDHEVVGADAAADGGGPCPTAW